MSQHLITRHLKDCKRYKICFRARLGWPKLRERLNERETRFVGERMGKGGGRTRVRVSLSLGVIDKRWIYDANERETSGLPDVFRERNPSAGRPDAETAQLFSYKKRYVLRHDVTRWKSDRLPAVTEKEGGSLRLATAP